MTLLCMVWTGTHGGLHSWSLVSGRLAYEGKLGFKILSAHTFFAGWIYKVEIEVWEWWDGWARTWSKTLVTTLRGWPGWVAGRYVKDCRAWFLLKSEISHICTITTNVKCPLQSFIQTHAKTRFELVCFGQF